MKKLSIFSLGLLLSFLPAISADILESSGTGTVQLTKIPADARNQALAGSAVAYQKGAESLFNNPAGLAFTERFDILSTYNKWLIDYNYITVAGAYGLERMGTFGVRAALLNKGSFEITGSSEKVDKTVSLNDISLTAGYGRRFLIKDMPLLLGAAVNFVSENLYSRSDSALFCDVGGILVILKDKLNVGFVLKNIGLVLGNGAFSPMEISAGASYHTLALEHYDLHTFLSFYAPFDSKFEIRIGNELTLFDHFIIRQGFKWKVSGYDLNLLSAFTFGAGYVYNQNLGLDIGYNNFDMLGHNFIVTFNLSF
jgi:hypothetical protein